MGQNMPEAAAGSIIPHFLLQGCSLVANSAATHPHSKDQPGGPKTATFCSGSWCMGVGKMNG